MERHRPKSEKKLTNTLAQIDQEQFIEKTDMAVGEWLTSWQRDYIGNVKRGTTVNYELHLLLYISPLIGLGYCLCLWLHYEASTCCL